MAREMTVGGTRIADDTACYVIAEIGNNHQGDVEVCKRMFKAAKECGAHAVKLQKRDNRTLFTRKMYESAYASENAFGPTYGAHREFLEFGHAQYRELRACADAIGITFFATAFDRPSADFLVELDMPAFKIASGDLTNIPLLKHVARFGRPMFVSTGGGTMEGVRRAYDAIMPINKQLCIMQCTAGYPPAWEELNIRVIETFRNELKDIVIGFSSHDSGIAMALIGYMLGCRVVEKHFTLNRAMRGTDHAFSLEAPGLRRVCRDLERARIALGDGVKRRYPSEDAPLLKMAKKLVAAVDLSAGTVIRPEHIAIKSPSDGTPPHMFDSFVGRRLTRALEVDDNLVLSDTEEVRR
jgi:N-acetylneuraminate synthase/sialic acid synthase